VRTTLSTSTRQATRCRSCMVLSNPIPKVVLYKNGVARGVLLGVPLGVILLYDSCHRNFWVPNSAAQGHTQSFVPTLNSKPSLQPHPQRNPHPHPNTEGLDPTRCITEAPTNLSTRVQSKDKSTVRVFDGMLHAWMLLVPTPARLKVEHACGQ
jgi:hypothetical protein